MFDFLKSVCFGDEFRYRYLKMSIGFLVPKTCFLDVSEDCKKHFSDPWNFFIWDIFFSGRHFFSRYPISEIFELLCYTLWSLNIVFGVFSPAALRATTLSLAPNQPRPLFPNFLRSSAGSLKIFVPLMFRTYPPMYTMYTVYTYKKQQRWGPSSSWERVRAPCSRGSADRYGMYRVKPKYM